MQNLFAGVWRKSDLFLCHVGLYLHTILANYYGQDEQPLQALGGSERC